MTDAEIFHEITRPLGGRLNRDVLPEDAKDVFAETEERAIDPFSSIRRFPPIYHWRPVVTPDRQQGYIPVTPDSLYEVGVIGVIACVFYSF